jgi:ribosomal protein S18 acetylase RimI-like enzyme
MLEITPLRHRDLAAVTELFNQATAALPYHWPLDPKSFRQLVLLHDPAPVAAWAVDPEGWLAATLDGHTVGFAHCTTGRLQDDDRHTRDGFLRRLVVLPKGAAAVAPALLSAADAYFRRQEVARVRAFPIQGGYPCHLAGRGALVSGDLEVMGALGRAGYRISQRWLLYEMIFGDYVVERFPQIAGLDLKIAAAAQGIRLVVTARAEFLAEIECALLPEVSQHTGVATASLLRLCVAQTARRRGLGRWLLLRCLNELVTRGVQRLVVDINHTDADMQGLLLHVGMQELPLTGYSYAKSLA